MRRANRVKTIMALSLAAMTSFISCITVDKTLGADFVPTDQDISIRTVELDLPVGQRLADSLQTTMSQTVIVGSLNTGESGKVNIGTALTISPSQDSIEWGTDPVFKEMYMDLVKHSVQTIDDNQAFIPQNIYVHQLGIELDSTHIYSNSVSKADISGNDVCRNACVYTGGDTLRVYFCKEFAESLFNVSRESLDSAELFMKDVYGFYFSTDEEDGAAGSGRINRFSTSSAYLTLKYTSTNGAGIRRDTIAHFDLGKYQDLMSIECGESRYESTKAEDIIRYQGLTGVKPYINGLELRTMLDGWMKEEGFDNSSILISKAVFEFPFEYSGNPEQLDAYPDNLYIVNRIRSDSYTVYTPISEIYNSSYDKGDINRSLMYYRPDAGIFLQNLLKKDIANITDEDDIWIMQVAAYTEDNSSSSYYDPYGYGYGYNPYGYGYGYDPYGYGYGGYGYGGYGYGYGGYSPYGYGYGYDPYGYGYGGYGYGYGYNNSSSSGTTYYYTDYMNYGECKLNGTTSERRPKLRITYTVLR